MAGIPPEQASLEAALPALASRVTELREATNMSQSQAAARGGLGPRNWSRIELGLHFPRLDSLLRVQSALDLDTIDALFAPTTGELLLERRVVNPAVRGGR
jgi:transcriptional regulator with XRE-family HTH domain